MCPTCSSKDVQELINNKLVTFIFPVPKSTLSKINRQAIRLYICSCCCHVFQYDINISLIDTIYSDFYRHYNLDTSIEFQKIYRDRTLKFIKENLIGTSNDAQVGQYKALDIGCGEGTYFPFFHDLGYECYGFEPSEKSKIADKNNTAAIISQAYFEEENENKFNVLFDVILLNWVLEHVLDLDKFFEKLKLYIKGGTKVFIQVPDLMYYVKNDLYLFYIHEHIHYFTPHSISKILNRHGFNLISHKQADCPALLLCAEYTRGSEVDYKKINKAITTQEINNFIVRGEVLGASANKLFGEYAEIFFYGVGTPTYWIGEYYLSKQIVSRVLILDDNEYYYNKHVPSFGCKVIQIKDIKKVTNACFFIGTSPVYREKIIKRIKLNIVGKFDIVYIHNNAFNIMKC